MESVQFVQSCARVATVQFRPLRSPVSDPPKPIPHSRPTASADPSRRIGLFWVLHIRVLKNTLLRGVGQGTQGDFIQGRGAVTTGRGATAWKRAGRTRRRAQPADSTGKCKFTAKEQGGGLRMEGYQEGASWVGGAFLPKEAGGGGTRNRPVNEGEHTRRGDSC